jgi:hypothetical protein
MRALAKKPIAQYKYFISMACLLATTGCTAQSSDKALIKSKMECIGRMQVSLPSDVEISAYSFDRFQKEIITGSNQQRFEFLDATNNDYDPYSVLNSASHASLYYSGEGFISHPLTDAQFGTLLGEIVKKGDAAKKIIHSSDTKIAGNSEENFKLISIGNKNGMAWSYGNFYRAFLKVGNNAFMWAVSFDKEEKDEVDGILNNILSGLSPRPLYTVPNKNGVCIPYAFIADGGKTPRNIAIAYRLADHPEIKITIKDATAANPEPGIRTQNKQPAQVIHNFWRQYLTSFAKGGGDEWASGTRTVTLAGYKGLSSFVKLIRKDDLVDYGYLAVVRGDPSAKDDTPDLMVHVIRDSHNAKGKEPMPKDEFLKMAETIAASVKRRPIE